MLKNEAMDKDREKDLHVSSHKMAAVVFFFASEWGLINARKYFHK